MKNKQVPLTTTIIAAIISAVLGLSGGVVVPSASAKPDVATQSDLLREREECRKELVSAMGRIDGQIKEVNETLTDIKVALAGQSIRVGH